MDQRGKFKVRLFNGRPGGGDLCAGIWAQDRVQDRAQDQAEDEQKTWAEIWPFGQAGEPGGLPVGAGLNDVADRTCGLEPLANPIGPRAQPMSLKPMSLK
jgi:hypothetical protein